MKLILALTDKSIENNKVAIASKEKKGWFMWLSTCGVVDRIVGYHNKRGFISDICYRTKKSFWGDLWHVITSKNSTVIICRHI